jgi:hypothetical protein
MLTTNDDDRLRDEWDVITGIRDGRVIWRRYSDGRIVVTHGDENPQDVVTERAAVEPGTRKGAFYDDH